MAPPSQALDLNGRWNSSAALATSRRKDWRAIQILASWMTWKERNSRIFDNKACLPAEVCDKNKINDE
jgi:hypothetical protein